MNQYFRLQFRLLSRKIRDAGILPVLAYPLVLVGFTGLSLYFFEKVEYAEYFYSAIALVYVFKLSELRRNDFLSLCFGSGLRRIRIAENVIVVSPFLLVLLYKQFIVFAAALLVAAILLACFYFRERGSITIPTPFYTRPFEFTVGFRKTFYLLLGISFLAFGAIRVDNFNLGVILLFFVVVICMSYYAKPENDYYVWIFSSNPRRFLVDKIKTALLFSTVLTLPVVLALGIFFPRNMPVLGLFLILGYAVLVLMILSKYAAYPDEMNLNQAFVVAICTMAPPLAIFFIPFLVFRSTSRLKGLLR